jgi:hypothetical protein
MKGGTPSDRVPPINAPFHTVNDKCAMVLLTPSKHRQVSTKVSCGSFDEVCPSLAKVESSVKYLLSRDGQFYYGRMRCAQYI